MPDFIPSGGALSTVDVDNTSAGRSTDATTPDGAAAWLCMFRRLQQPVSFGPYRVGATDTRYQTVLVPPGSTHVMVGCLYTGEVSGPEFYIEMPPGAGFGAASTMPPANPDGTPVIENAKWHYTTFADADDAAPGDMTHLNVKDIGGRNDDEWQLANVKMVFPAAAIATLAVHAWSTWPVYLGLQATP